MPKLLDHRTPEAKRYYPPEYYLGIDIGKKGGIALVERSGKLEHYEAFPDTHTDIKNSLATLVDNYDIKRCVVEKIWAFKGTQKTAAFSMGYSMGVVEATLSFLEIPYTLVAAVTWQKKFNLPSRAGGQLDNKDHKERLRALAQKLFPSLPLWKESKTKGLQLAVCDSMLIADHCRRENV